MRGDAPVPEWGPPPPPLPNPPHDNENKWNADNDIIDVPPLPPQPQHTNGAVPAGIIALVPIYLVAFVDLYGAGADYDADSEADDDANQAVGL